jgi:hypothetical protein
MNLKAALVSAIISALSASAAYYIASRGPLFEYTVAVNDTCNGIAQKTNISTFVQFKHLASS